MHRLIGLLPIILILATGPAGAQPSPAGPVNVSDTPGDSTGPAIAVLSDGTRHVAWQEDDGQIYVAMSQAEGWAVNPLAEGDSPALAIGSGGNPHLVFVAEDDAGNLEVFHSQWSAGDWSPPANVSLSSGSSTAPDIAMAPDGTPRFVWTDTTPGEPTLYYGTPNEAGPIFNARGTAPAIAIDSTNQIHVVWQEPDDDTGLGEVYHISMNLDEGQNGAFAENLSDSPDVDSRLPTIAISPDGTAHVVWLEGGAVQVRSGQPANFSSAVIVSGTATDAGSPRIARDAAGNVMVAWTEGDAQIRVAIRWRDMSAWEAPQRVAGSLEGLELLAMDSGATGEVHFAWSAFPVGGTAGDVYVMAVELAPAAMNEVYLPLIAAK